MIESFRDLRVWKLGMEVADAALAACEQEPLSRKFRLAGQLEAAACSIPANIAEGHASGSTPNYLKHLYIARGSLAETRTLLELFDRRRYITEQQTTAVGEDLDALGKMLNALIASPESRPVKGRKPRPEPPKL
jgi:four helix bundle protein